MYMYKANDCSPQAIIILIQLHNLPVVTVGVKLLEENTTYWRLDAPEACRLSLDERKSPLVLGYALRKNV